MSRIDQTSIATNRGVSAAESTAAELNLAFAKAELARQISEIIAERGLTLEDLRVQRTEILRMASAHGARNVRVFGSVARGDATAHSDVDFLVDLEPGRTVLDLSELTLDLTGAIGRNADVVEIRRPSEVANRIECEAIPR